MDVENPEVCHVFQQSPPQIRQVLLTIRQWIFEIADNSEEIGKVNECLKWGQPSYVTHTPKTGTTLRLSQTQSCEVSYGLFVHCQTSLIEEFRVAYPHLKYDKNRALIFDSRDVIQVDIIKQFIYLALTYHCRRK